MSQNDDKNEAKESGEEKTAEEEDADVGNCREHIWFHRPRLPEEEELSTCFICCKGKEEEEVGDFYKCSIDGCSVHFHEFCIEEDYNAADYSASSLKTVTEMKDHKKKPIDGRKEEETSPSYQCPIHHCSECWNEKKKSSAVVGTMVQCSDCYRAFHKECTPAAAEIAIKQRNGREIEMTKCHQHGPIKPIPKTNRIKFCYVCLQRRRQIKLPSTNNDSPSKEKSKLDEDDGDMKKPKKKKKKYKTKEEEMMECLGCLRVFHEQCFDKKIKGARVEGAWCSKCVDGVTFADGARLITYYPPEKAFYPCTVISLDKMLPAVKAHYTKGVRNFYGVAHKIPIQWAGVNNMQDYVDSWSVIHMFDDSRPLFMMENDENFTSAWDEFERSHRRIGPDTTKMRTLERKAFIKITSSVYHDSVDFTTVYRYEDADDYNCHCKAEENEPRCDDNSKCHNLSMDLECPPSCWEGTRAGKCTNNEMQLKAICKNVQVRITKEKGHGVFATANISKGTFIAEYAGEIISKEEKADRMESSTQRDNSEEHHYMMDIGDGLTIDCKRKGNDARFINHSCEPNCKAQIKSIPIKCHKGRIMYGERVGIYAIRDIKEGDELSFFYAMTAYEEGTLPPPCYCGTASCGKYLGRVRGKEDEKENKKKTPKSAKTAKPSAVKRKLSTPLRPRDASVPAKRGPLTPARFTPTVTTPSGRPQRSVSRTPLLGAPSTPRSAARTLGKSGAVTSDALGISTPVTSGSVKKRIAMREATPHPVRSSRGRSITTSESLESSDGAWGSNEAEPHPSPSASKMKDSCEPKNDEIRRSARSMKKRIVFSPSGKGPSPKKRATREKVPSQKAAEEAASPTDPIRLLTPEDTEGDRQFAEIKEEVLPELLRIVEERERPEEKEEEKKEEENVEEWEKKEEEEEKKDEEEEKKEEEEEKEEEREKKEEEEEKKDEEEEKNEEEEEKREDEKEEREEEGEKKEEEDEKKEEENEKREEEQAEVEEVKQEEMKKEVEELREGEKENEMPLHQEDKMEINQEMEDKETPEEMTVKMEASLSVVEPTANIQAQEGTDGTDASGIPELIDSEVYITTINTRYSDE